MRTHMLAVASLVLASCGGSDSSDTDTAAAVADAAAPADSAADVAVSDVSPAPDNGPADAATTDTSAPTPGARVTRGEVLGREGSSGYSTGPHLHFEVRVNGQLTDPLRYLP